MNSLRCDSVGIGKRIREKRKELNISGEQLANMSGINVKTLYNIELGKKCISFNSFSMIVEALDVSADWLMGREFKER
ncbi:MAG: helix-turn-helix domain-containing protein [Lachnospiraceae bacterium]|nr:helix-turn-helix domain-containing protein [Lachnospiraceae bacterium]